MTCFSYAKPHVKSKFQVAKNHISSSIQKQNTLHHANQSSCPSSSSSCSFPSWPKCSQPRPITPYVSLGRGFFNFIQTESTPDARAAALTEQAPKVTFEAGAVCAGGIGYDGTINITPQKAQPDNRAGSLPLVAWCTPCSGTFLSILHR